MTINVTIRRAGITNSYGLPLNVGTTYALDDAFALSLISNGGATDVDGVTREGENDFGLAGRVFNTPSDVPAEELTSANVAGVRANLLRQRATTLRPFIGSFGDSISSQDAPTNYGTSTEGASSVSPMFWTNALSLSAFDFIGPVQSSVVASGGPQTLSQTFTNGVLGYSGGRITQFQKNAIDQYLALMLQQVGSRPFVVLLSGGMNDFNNSDADTAGYDATVWADYLTIVQKVVAAGGFPVLKCNEPSINRDSVNKRKNMASFTERVMTYAAGRGDCAAINVQALQLKYADGMPLERMTRGSTGDNVHPNSIGAIIYGLGYAEALSPFFQFCPPWERSDFAGTFIGSIYALTGTGGTKGTNANVASVVPTSWTLNAFGTNNTVLSTAGVSGEGPGFFVDCSASGTPTADRIGFDSIGQTVDTSTVYRVYTDMDIFQADYTSQIYFRIRRDSTNYGDYPGWSGTDNRAMTADYPNGPKLLEGRRLVMQTFPFRFPAASAASMFNVGGGYGLEVTSAARLRTFTRFGGIVSGV